MVIKASNYDTLDMLISLMLCWILIDGLFIPFTRPLVDSLVSSPPKVEASDWFEKEQMSILLLPVWGANVIYNGSWAVGNVDACHVFYSLPHVQLIWVEDGRAHATCASRTRLWSQPEIVPPRLITEEALEAMFCIKDLILHSIGRMEGFSNRRKHEDRKTWRHRTRNELSDFWCLTS